MRAGPFEEEVQLVGGADGVGAREGVRFLPFRRLPSPLNELGPALLQLQLLREVGHFGLLLLARVADLAQPTEPLLELVNGVCRLVLEMLLFFSQLFELFGCRHLFWCGGVMSREALTGLK